MDTTIESRTGKSESRAANSEPRTQSNGRRLTGVLRGLTDRGFGFIKPDNGEPDYYVNVASMRDRSHWVEGRRVSFLPGVATASKKAPPAFAVAAIRAKETVKNPVKTAGKIAGKTAGATAQPEEAR